MVDAPQWYHFRGMRFLMDTIPSVKGMPMWVLIVLNVLIPGAGTMISGALDAKVLLVCLVIGFLQFISGWLLVGIVWSWFWAWLIYSKSTFPDHDYEDVDNQKRRVSKTEVTVQKPEIAVDGDNSSDEDEVLHGQSGEVYAADTPRESVDPLDQEYQHLLSEIRESKPSDSFTGIHIEEEDYEDINKEGMKKIENDMSNLGGGGQDQYQDEYNPL